MSRFAYIFDDGKQVGDVTFFDDGTATVINLWSGVQQWFDNPETGHEDAVRYIRSRMAPMFEV
jgi:hypothetical protein